MSDSEVERWTEAPVEIRRRLVEQLKNGEIIDALKDLMQFRNTPLPEKPILNQEETAALAAAKSSILRLKQAVDHTPCPFCGTPLRHPLAQQCLECRTDWHGKTPPDKRW